MLIKDSGGVTFEQAPVGTHVARCIKLIDLGTQTGEYLGQATKKRQLLVSWELPNALMTTGEFKGKPFSASKFYTMSLNEKSALRKDLVTWRGREFTPDELNGFEAKNILGKPCMISITLNQNGKAKVSAVMSLPQGMTCPPQVNPSILFDLSNFSHEVFNTISKGIQAIIEKSPEFKHVSMGDLQGTPAAQEEDEDIPF